MKSTLSLIALTLLLHASTLAQPPGDPQRLVVHLDDRTLNSGYYLDLSSDSLILFSDDRALAIAIDDLVRIDRLIVPERELGPVGMVAGFYFGTALQTFGRSRSFTVGICSECSNGYLSAGTGDLFIGLVWTLPPGLIGYLLDNNTTAPDRIGRDETMTLDGDPHVRRREIRELAESLESASRRRVSIDVHGGYIVASSQGSTQEALDRSGYRRDLVYTAGFTNRFNSYWEPPTSLLWFRRAELHYRVFDEVDLGLALVNLADPGMIVQRTDPVAGGTRARTVSEGTEGSSYLLTGRYRPLADSRFGSGLELGAGLGIAEVRHHRYGFDDTLDANRRMIGRQGNGSGEIFENSPLAGLVAVSYSLPISQAMTLGISADCLLTTSTTLPGTSWLDVPERQTSPGNASIGLILGWRF